MTDDENLKLQRWGEEQLRTCLRFLVLDNRQKLDYLPAPFPEMTFHMVESDLLTGSPLRFLCSLTQDVCRYSPNSSDAVQQLLHELMALLDVMQWSENRLIWDLSLCIDQRRQGVSWAFIWDVAARLAGDVLQLLGWMAGEPDLPCQTLLDTYSYGVYSTVIHANQV